MHLSMTMDRQCSSAHRARAKRYCAPARELNFHVDAVHLTFPALSPADLLVHLAQEFGGNMEPTHSLQLALQAPPDQFALMAKNVQSPVSHC